MVIHTFSSFRYITLFLGEYGGNKDMKSEVGFERETVWDFVILCLKRLFANKQEA